MRQRRIRAVLAWLGLGAVGAAAALAAAPPGEGRVPVAVVNADLAAIAQRVGGRDVAITVLFTGCVLRPGLEVEGGALAGLVSAEAVVWSGLFHESAAIFHAVENLTPEQRERLRQPLWIDASQGTVRVKVPTSSCEGFVPIQFMHGDPYFWLNPENGAVIARTIAAGLAQLRPGRVATFQANAEAFAADLAGRIQGWRARLAHLAGTKIFITQCGWANLARLGPAFMSCRSEPGVLVKPPLLAEQINGQQVPIVVVDPHTPEEYAETFRTRTRARVVVIPSSIAEIPGAREYHALFDHLVERLLVAAGQAGSRGARGGGDA